MGHLNGQNPEARIQKIEDRRQKAEGGDPEL
jgi:hypothetical protein